MRSSVPQYIGVEDKLMGLVTFKQLFLFLAAFIISYIGSKVVGGLIELIIVIISFGLAVALGFINLNGKPVLSSLPSLFYFFGSNRKYAWQSMTKIVNKTIELPELEKYLKEPPPGEKPIETTEQLLIKNPKTPPPPVSPAEPVPIIKETPWLGPEKQIAPKPEIKIQPPAPATPIQTEINNQPLISVVKKIQPTPNNYNPYKNFPLPKFPKRRW